MELKLFDSKLVNPVGVGRISCLSLRHDYSGCFGFSLELCSCRGMSLKASYSSISNGNSIKENNVREDNLYKINRTNGSPVSSLFPTSMRMLDAYDDEYGGVVVDPNRLPVNPDSFVDCLHFSLSRWRLEGKKGVWLKLPANRSELVPLAIKEGFEYHHAEPGYVMLTYWIPEGPCKLPTNATHQVGVGGFVINEKNEVLVVQEKFCAPSFVGLWKIPTGFIHESEEIYTGAVREIKEETGIETEFLEVVAFRHAHNLAFDKSDLFFVCMLKPSSNQIILDDHEIQAAKWMPLDEFVEQPLIKSDSMFKKIIDICIARLGKHYCGLYAHKLVSKFDGRLSCLYYNVVDHSQNGNCIGN